MGGDTGGINLQEIATLYSRLPSPDKKAVAAALRVQLLLGEEHEAADTRNLLLRESCAFAAHTIDRLIPEIRKAIRNCATRLRYEGRLRLVGQLVSLLGSSSVVGALSLQQPTAAAITGVITLLASGAVMIADYFITSGGRKLDVQAIFEQLNDASFQSAILSVQLKALIADPASSQETIATKIKEANDLARLVIKTLGQILLSPEAISITPN